MTIPTVDRDAVRARLMARRREVLARYNTQLALAEEELSPEIEATETATEQTDAVRLSALAEADGRTLDQIGRALARLDAGGYGVCVICRNPIGDERLTALPETVTCVECATGRDELTT